MASGGNEHRMVFDIRGRRKHVVKAVYAVLAVLMGASLFLVVGPVNIGQLFSSTSATSEAAKPFEEQAEHLQVKLKKDPENPELLLALTRAQVNAGNNLVTIEANGARGLTPEAFQQYQQASNTWSEYLAATKEPSPNGAQLVVPALVTLAESSRSFPESESNIEGAVAAQKIVAEQRPNLNSLSTLALYTLFTGDYAAAKKAEEEALKFAHPKSEKKELEKKLGVVSKNAHTFQKSLKAAEAEAKAGAKGHPESLENPLGGTFGSSGLGE